MTVHVDAMSLIPGNYKVLQSLPDQPQIKASPELQKAVRDAITQIEGLRGMAKAASGIDPTTDIYDATMFAQFVPGQSDPSALVAVHGNFSAAQLDKIAGTTGSKVVKVGGGAMLETGKDAVGVTKDKVLLAGAASLVRDRLADAWKAPAHGAGTTLGNVGAVIDGKPVFAVVLTMSAAARKEAIKAIGGGQNFATDVIQRHKLAAFAVYHDGIGWQWIDSNKSGLDAIALISDGFIDVLRAANIAPRGFAKIVMGGLDSYKGDKRVDELLKHKDDIQKLVESYTGDGTFQKKLDKDPNKLTLTVRLTGKSLSDVVPLVLPLVGAGAFLGLREGGRPATVPAPAYKP